MDGSASRHAYCVFGFTYSVWFKTAEHRQHLNLILMIGAREKSGHHFVTLASLNSWGQMNFLFYPSKQHITVWAS